MAFFCSTVIQSCFGVDGISVAPALPPAPSPQTVQMNLSEVPMPQLIPRPKATAATGLDTIDAKLIEIGNARYVECRLPEGWAWKNETTNPSMQRWYLVDSVDICYAQITGQWTDAERNKLVTLWLMHPVPLHEYLKRPRVDQF